MPDAITPFTISISDEVLADLTQRLGCTRWPEKETVTDWSQGIPLAYVREVCEYWRTTYDWRERERHLNQFPQFHTPLTGGSDEPVDIHFIHVRSPEQNAFPIVLTHGWPGSTVEFMNVIAPLADPRSHGGDPADAFHVVVPSLPGYGFSGKPTRPGWSIERVAAAWDELMVRLGYEHYGAQGGDWGGIISHAIGVQNLGRCVAVHLNIIIAPPTPELMADLTEAEKASLARSAEHQQWGRGYSELQRTRPQTVGYGLVDSPVGQAAWILEKFFTWTDNAGLPEDAVPRDELLDNVMMYWLNGSGASSARMYWESIAKIGQGGPVTIPSGISQFPKEIAPSSRRWAERVYTDLRYWNELDRGGHFAAMEQPDLFVDEVRKFFRRIGRQRR